MSYSEQIDDIIEELNGDPSTLPDGLWSTKLDYIIELLEGGGPGGGAAWGQITGTLANQTDLAAALTAKLAIAQGVGEAGKFLVVGQDGNITTQTLQTWQGGSY